MPSCHFSVRYPNLSLEPTTAAAAISATGVILRWMFEQYAREGPLAASGWVAERGTAWASVCARYDTGRSIPARQLALSTLTSRSICSRADVQKIKLPSIYGELHQSRERPVRADRKSVV